MLPSRTNHNTSIKDSNNKKDFFNNRTVDVCSALMTTSIDSYLHSLSRIEEKKERKKKSPLEILLNNSITILNPNHFDCSSLYLIEFITVM
jgi:hypothetical protein